MESNSITSLDHGSGPPFTNTPKAEACQTEGELRSTLKYPAPPFMTHKLLLREVRVLTFKTGSNMRAFGF